MSRFYQISFFIALGVIAWLLFKTPETRIVERLVHQPVEKKAEPAPRPSSSEPKPHQLPTIVRGQKPEHNPQTVKKNTLLPGEKELAFAYQLSEDKKYLNVIEFIDSTEFYSFAEEAKKLHLHAALEWSTQSSEDKKFHQSIQLLQMVLDHHPNEIILMEKIALNWVELGQARKALEELDRAKLASLKDTKVSELERLQEKIIKAHLLFLEKNEDWIRLIDFSRFILSRGHQDYIKFQFAEALGHWKLNRFNEASLLFEQVRHDRRFAARIHSFMQKLNPSNQQPKQAAENQVEQVAILQDESDEDLIPLFIQNDSIFVKVIVNDSTQTLLLLDTGASMIHLSERVSSGLFIRTKKRDRIFITAGGKIKSPIVLLDSVSLGTFKVKNLEAAVSNISLADEGAQGVLGMNFLKHFDFSIDVDKQVMRLKAKK